MLGKGAYGVVYRGHHSDVRKGRNMVAIKVIQIDVAVKKGSNIKVGGRFFFFFLFFFLNFAFF
jgi:hypothetical protein